MITITTSASVLQHRPSSFDHAQHRDHRPRTMETHAIRDRRPHIMETCRPSTIETTRHSRPHAIETFAGVPGEPTFWHQEEEVSHGDHVDQRQQVLSISTGALVRYDGRLMLESMPLSFVCVTTSSSATRRVVYVWSLPFATAAVTSLDHLFIVPLPSPIWNYLRRCSKVNTPSCCSLTHERAASEQVSAALVNNSQGHSREIPRPTPLTPRFMSESD
jgi:hypothetical protein